MGKTCALVSGAEYMTEMFNLQSLLFRIGLPSYVSSIR